ncbi:hypothetical protein ACPV3A_16505 [Paenibacillus sp. Dod16]|uniref:hypothetical protein n=1 Tax=Paenibacillus TaxID=44249 RepID=UPI0020403F5A|nr:hypothetical protein [Paenibacillus lactis]MCM3492864.1 hypothetical protein [Paenibacillus lactis]
MNIKDFERFRIDSNSFCFMDIEKIGHHSNNGFMATAYLMGATEKYIQQKVEVRKKERQVALITYHYSDAEIPEYWRDAEVLFSWTEPVKEE